MKTVVPEQPEFISEMQFINDATFQEVLFNAKSQQLRIHFQEMKTLTTKQILQLIIDFYALAGYGITVRLYRTLEKQIPQIVAELP
jgi:hypothetical protein